ncbi:MAG TPA: hypothetical protein VG826_06700 [Pirellulales bacterium]|nr:hypothetical protein [Pirellulales bacterium]
MSPVIALTAWMALAASPRLPIPKLLTNRSQASASQAINDSNTVLMTDGTTRVSLKVQLERGLRAMRPVEFKFLREVIKQVNNGTLPQDMVEMAFLWAHRQRAYRVQYFEKALRALADQNNIQFTTKVSSFNPGFNQQ